MVLPPPLQYLASIHFHSESYTSKSATRTDNDYYAIKTAAGDLINVIWQSGDRLNDSSIGTWSARRVVEHPDGEGYLVYWDNTDGSETIWEVDANGARTSGNQSGTAEFAGFEAAFGTDFNGDGTVGHAYTVRDATGFVKLLTTDTDNDHYVIETTAGDLINVTLRGDLLNDASLDGWSALHAAENPDGEGYLVYWENVDGTRYLWELDANGNQVFGYEADTPLLMDVETAFGVDFNEDGTLGFV